MSFNQYNETVQYHYHHPQHVGELAEDDSEVHLGQAGSPASGEFVKVWLKIDAEQVVSQVAFKAYGSAATIAATSYLLDHILGLSVAVIARLTVEQINQVLMLPSTKHHAIMRALQAVLSALEAPGKKSP